MRFRDRIGRLFIVLGVVFVLSSAALVGYNTYVEKQAEDASGSVVASLREVAEDAREKEISEEEAVDQEVSDRDKEKVIMDQAYMGILEIPKLALELPIASEFSYAQLKHTPCAYLGSIEENDLVIAGHNYKVHFKNLKELVIGDMVTITDVKGNVYQYEVFDKEVVEEEQIEELQEDGDLTLFTCYTNNTKRVIVRFHKLPLQN